MICLAEIFRDAADFERVLLCVARLGVAALLGAVLGFERQLTHHSAGMRTHMMVALGAALFTLVPFHSELRDDALSRVIQGVATGVGFLGAGAILKAEDKHRVRGLTTAAGLWLTAGVGMSVGAGFLTPAIVAVLVGLIILEPVERFEKWFELRQQKQQQSETPPKDTPS